MRKIITLLVVLMMAATCSTALAKGKKPNKEARKQFKQGIALYEDGKYEQASIAFERAYELQPSYKLLYNIGQVEAELEHYAAAFTAYNRYLEEGKDEIKPKRMKAVQTEIERLETLVGFIKITSPVDDAKVKLNKEVVGTTPIVEPILVDIGKHEVAVEHEGESLFEEVVKVAGGETVELTVEIKKEPVVVPVAPEPLLPPEEPKRVWTWVAGGVGVAAGIAAAITGGVASSKSKDLEENCTGNDCLKSQWDTLDSSRNLATTTNVLIGVAAAGVAAGVALYFLEPKFGEENSTVVAPVVTDDSASIAITGRF